MKYLFLVLLLPLQLLAQKPVRSYEFISRKQPGLFNGACAISPRGNFILATFNDFDKKAVYELVDIATRKLISSGALPAIPQEIAWSDDEKLVAINYREMNAECYSVQSGLKKTFAAGREGFPVFSRNTQVLAAKFFPELFLFGDEYAYRYNMKGVLLDSVEINAYALYSGIWFDLLRDRFVLAEDGAGSLHGYSPKTKIFAEIASHDPDGLVRDMATDKEGALFLYYTENDLFVHDAGNGKRITQYKFNKISAACFTPDSKNILVFDDQNVNLLNLQGKLVKSIKRPGYYSGAGYRSFGMEMIALNPSGFDIYNCQDYFFVKEEPIVNKPPVVTTPPAVNNPVKSTPVKTTPVTKTKPWTLPYKIQDFITPFNKDSFYLYTADKALRYFIRYERGSGGLFSDVSFHYSQFFGFGNEAKYKTAINYTIDMTDSTARLSTYSRASWVGEDDPLMIGGQNYLGQISSTPGKILSWPMNLFKEQYILSAKLIDHTYNGKKAKCLVVTRDEPGKNINESYYYQQGVGLIRIDSGGKVAFSR